MRRYIAGLAACVGKKSGHHTIHRSIELPAYTYTGTGLPKHSVCLSLTHITCLLPDCLLLVCATNLVKLPEHSEASLT